MNKIILALLLTAFAPLSYSQLIQLSQTTYVTRDFYTGQTSTSPFKKYQFRLEGEHDFRKVGAGGKKVRPYLSDDPEALKYLDHYRAKRGAASASIVLAFASLTTFAVKNMSDTELQNPEDSVYAIRVFSWPVSGLLLQILCLRQLLIAIWSRR